MGLGALVATGVGVGVCVGLGVTLVRSAESSPPSTPQLRGKNSAKRAKTMNLGTVRPSLPRISGHFYAISTVQAIPGKLSSTVFGFSSDRPQARDQGRRRRVPTPGPIKESDLVVSAALCGSAPGCLLFLRF